MEENDLTLSQNVVQVSKDRVQSCKMCNKLFSSQRSLSMHMYKHKDVVYLCNLENCHLVFSSAGEFNAHRNYHKSDLRCAQCGVRFYKKSALTKHVDSVHAKVKKFHCSHCGKGFFQRMDLVNHERIHDKVKLHKCDVCNRKFSHVSNLNRHKRVHTKEKPFCCNQCGKRFTQSSTLQTHKMFHQKDLKPTCVHCNKKFTRVSRLNAHLASVHNIVIEQNLSLESSTTRKYHCYVCGEQFEMKIQLAKHTVLMHSSSLTRGKTTVPPPMVEGQEVSLGESSRAVVSNSVADIAGHRGQQVNSTVAVAHFSGQKYNPSGTNAGRSQTINHHDEIQRIKFSAHDNSFEREECSVDSNDLYSDDESTSLSSGSDCDKCDGEASENQPDNVDYEEAFVETSTTDIETNNMMDTKLHQVAVSIEETGIVDQAGIADMSLNNQVGRLENVHTSETEVITLQLPTAERSENDTTAVSREISLAMSDVQQNLEKRRVSPATEMIVLHNPVSTILKTDDKFPNQHSSTKIKLDEISTDVKNSEQVQICVTNLNKEVFLQEAPSSNRDQILRQQLLSEHEQQQKESQQHFPFENQQITQALVIQDAFQADHNFGNVIQCEQVEIQNLHSFSQGNLISAGKEQSEIKEIHLTCQTSVSNQEPLDCHQTPVHLQTAQQFSSQPQISHFQTPLVQTLLPSSNEHTSSSTLSSCVQQELDPRVVQVSGKEQLLTSHPHSSAGDGCQVLSAEPHEFLHQQRGSHQPLEVGVRPAAQFEDADIHIVSGDPREMNLVVSSEVVVPFAEKEEVQEKVSIKQQGIMVPVIISPKKKIKTTRKVMNDATSKDKGKKFSEEMNMSHDEVVHTIKSIITNLTSAPGKERTPAREEEDEVAGVEDENAGDSHVDVGDEDHNKLENTSCSLKTKDPPDKVQENPQKKFVCPECGKRFEKPCFLKSHRGTHDESLKYSCNLCDAKFCWKSRLQTHISRVHSHPDNQPEYKCGECDKSFTASSSLSNHVKNVHRKLKPFSCDQCEKKFFKKADLQVHARVHSRTKPYTCTECNKKFGHVSHLHRHTKLHNRGTAQ